MKRVTGSVVCLMLQQHLEFKEKDKEFIRWIQQEIESLPIKVEYNCEITTLAAADRR